MKKSETIQKLYDRDGNICGPHTGGCGKDVLRNDASVDHIIPKMLIHEMAPRQKDILFNADFNKQIMHEKCNNSRQKDGGDLPPFHCICHAKARYTTGHLEFWTNLQTSNKHQKHMYPTLRIIFRNTLKELCVFHLPNWIGIDITPGSFSPDDRKIKIAEGNLHRTISAMHLLHVRRGQRMRVGKNAGGMIIPYPAFAPQLQDLIEQPISTTEAEIIKSYNYSNGSMFVYNGEHSNQVATVSDFNNVDWTAEHWGTNFTQEGPPTDTNIQISPRDQIKLPKNGLMRLRLIEVTPITKTWIDM